VLDSLQLQRRRAETVLEFDRTPMLRFLTSLDPVAALSTAALLAWRRGETVGSRRRKGARDRDVLAAGRRPGRRRAVGFDRRGLPGPSDAFAGDDEPLVLAPLPDEPTAWWRRLLRGILLGVVVALAAAALAAALWALGRFLTGEVARYFESS
jgi:hypothetical protein